jgi:hypothetical protein
MILHTRDYHTKSAIKYGLRPKLPPKSTTPPGIRYHEATLRRASVRLEGMPGSLRLFILDCITTVRIEVRLFSRIPSCSKENIWLKFAYTSLTLSCLLSEFELSVVFMKLCHGVFQRVRSDEHRTFHPSN